MIRTAKDLMNYISISNPHVEDVMLQEGFGGEGDVIIFTVKLSFWYGLLFRGVYRRWLTKVVRQEVPGRIESIVLVII